ncbi:hypothetical protein BASA60_003634 [Batrachochytrium salamandrivorans]|nr:hypothetical protein BASA60_003634 [Batrachochytrium salamandrivorans]
MSKRAKPLLLEEKRRRMLSIFHETVCMSHILSYCRLFGSASLYPSHLCSHQPPPPSQSSLSHPLNDGLSMLHFYATILPDPIHTALYIAISLIADLLFPDIYNLLCTTQKSFFNLKEIEKIAPKSKGIIEKSVKEVVDGLVADNLIQMEKIGASNYYWSFPDANAHQARMRLEAVSEELVAIKEKERQIQLEMSDAMSARQETHERRLVIAELEAASLLEAKLTLEVDRYKDSDPEVLRAKELGANIAFEAANRWTGL